MEVSMTGMVVKADRFTGMVRIAVPTPDGYVETLELAAIKDGMLPEAGDSVRVSVSWQDAMPLRRA